ncbi:hypothetical protein BOTBODRAFT_66387 [Botryobasidium botryosum FD-172 SS1]|uniref:Hemerythrin-like domain-containing protein n=1 Tax=Botryobasidium botryosum (strain FD-172 SS1) TaxID=930990 RepID=A0A067MDU2_BOTB1|nr:hypothetical protein BOTBODRAFT_66387 [Botryobasidium botryosum FD-172 SS1]
MTATTIKKLKDGLCNILPYADGPAPSDIFIRQQWEMAGAHAMIANGLISVYEQASSIQKAQAVDFVGYALQWVAAVTHHHDWEETIYYPLYAPKFETSQMVAEHASFTEGLHLMETYLISCLPRGTKWGYGVITQNEQLETYDSTKLLSIIGSFAEPLVQHLQKELEYLDPAKIKASGLTEDEVRHIDSVSEKHMTSMSPFTFLTYVVLATPKSSGFPPAPWFVKNVLVPYVFYWYGRAWWKFAPKN